jgi:hypothetical protein
MTTVKTQAELDKALAEHAAEIIIDSPTGVWLTITDSGSSRVEAWGSSRVVARGSSRVVARGSSRVVARGSSRVVARGSSRVVARGSSRVEARESSRVEARESSRVEASKYVAVHLHSQRVTMTGTGHVIDMTAVDPQTLTDWLALSGAKTVDGKLRVYKAVDAELASGQGFTYPIGEHLTDKKWRDGHECGGGLRHIRSQRQPPRPGGAEQLIQG